MPKFRRWPHSRIRITFGATLAGALLVAFASGASNDVSTAAAGAVTTMTFAYTGGEQSFTVPTGVTSLQLVATGAVGGAGAASSSEATASSGGLPATAADTVAVTPGTTYAVDVGGPGGAASENYSGPNANNGGFNGGAASGVDGGGGGGGGASDVCTTPLHSVIDPTACLIVAGGGGGAGGSGSNSLGGAGGNAGQAGTQGGGGGTFGGLPGSPGTATGAGAGGAGGTGTGSGNGNIAGGTGVAGQLGNGGTGGDNVVLSGGGGGAGLYGGGGGGAGDFNINVGNGAAAGGGGGSSYAPGGSITLASTGVAAQVTISYTVSPPSVKFANSTASIDHKSGSGAVSATCDAPAGQSCIVRATLYGPGKLPAGTANASSTRNARVLGTLKGTLGAGKAGKLALHLNATALRELRRKHKYSERLRGLVRDQAGNTGEITLSIKLEIT